VEEAGELLRWFRANARALPWRSEPRDPYRVLLSEVMLQQTQVERVVPLYEEFVRRFPNLASLAAASEDEVVTAWSGLGYYRRARALHRLARRLAAHGGVVPRSMEALLSLPGIGPYTAAAVMSLAFGEREPVLDGNVLRVGARVLALAGDPRAAAGGRRLRRWVLGLMEGGDPAQVNEALMELGATVCTPVGGRASGPACTRCPLARHCRALAEERPGAFPPPRRTRAPEEHRWVVACVRARDGRWLLRRVGTGPILRGLWLPPFADIGEGDDAGTAAVGLSPVKVGEAEVRPAVRHSITHRRITVVPVRMEAARAADPGTGWRWVDPDRPGLPTSSLLAKLVAACRS